MSEYDLLPESQGIVLSRPLGLIFPVEQMWIVGRYYKYPQVISVRCVAISHIFSSQLPSWPQA